MKENANSLKDGAGAAPYEEPPEVTSRSDEAQFLIYELTTTTLCPLLRDAMLQITWMSC